LKAVAWRCSAGARAGAETQTFRCGYRDSIEEEAKQKEAEKLKHEEEEKTRKAEEEKKRAEEEARLRREAEEAKRREAERQAREKEEERKRKEEEEQRQREEEELLRKQQLEREAAEQARRQKEEDERKEREIRERLKREEAERKRAAHEAEVRRLREEERQQRLAKLPPLLRWLDGCPNPQTHHVAKKFSRIVGVRYDTIRPEALGTPEGREQWVLNTHVALLLGIKDLELARFTSWDRLPVSDLAKQVLWMLERDQYSLVGHDVIELGTQVPGLYTENEPLPRLDIQTMNRLRKETMPLFKKLDMFFVKVRDHSYPRTYMSLTDNSFPTSSISSPRSPIYGAWSCSSPTRNSRRTQRTCSNRLGISRMTRTMPVTSGSVPVGRSLSTENSSPRSYLGYAQRAKRLSRRRGYLAGACSRSTPTTPSMCESARSKASTICSANTTSTRRARLFPTASIRRRP